MRRTRVKKAKFLRLDLHRNYKDYRNLRLKFCFLQFYTGMHEITSQEQAYMNYESISNIFNDENELVSHKFPVHYKRKVIR